jgi:TonB family protein
LLTPRLILSAAILLIGTQSWSQDSMHPSPLIAPREIDTPEAEYSDAGRKAKRQGTVLLAVIVDSNGSTHDVKVLVPLGFGLDGKAVEAVRQWKFAPAMKDGKSVAALIHVAVRFRLYTAGIGQVELASDAKDVDLTAYLGTVIQKMNNQWARQAISTNKTEVTLQFAIE